MLSAVFLLVVAAFRVGAPYKSVPKELVIERFCAGYERPVLVEVDESWFRPVYQCAEVGSRKGFSLNRRMVIPISDVDGLCGDEGVATFSQGKVHGAFNF